LGATKKKPSPGTSGGRSVKKNPEKVNGQPAGRGTMLNRWRKGQIENTGGKKKTVVEKKTGEKHKKWRKRIGWPRPSGKLAKLGVCKKTNGEPKDGDAPKRKTQKKRCGFRANPSWRL